MGDPETSPFDDLPPLGGDADTPFDPLDEAIAELQNVVDKDRDMGPMDSVDDSVLGDMEAEPAEEPARRANDGLEGVVMSIPVQIDVVIGSAQMPVADLIGMEAGSIVSLDSKIGEHVDICVNGTKIAVGEIQTLEDDPSRLGVKIISLSKN